MAHGLRGLALLLAAATVGCTAPEKIAPQRISSLPPPQPLPKPDLSPSPTGPSKPASPPIDNRGQPKPATPTPPALPDAPMPGQPPVLCMPVVGGNPAVAPGATKPSGVNPVYTPADMPKPAEPAPLGKPIEVIPLPQPPK